MATGESRYGAGDLLSVPALTKSGTRISVEFTIVMLRDERGLPDGTVAVLRDVTKSFSEKIALRREIAELRHKSWLVMNNEDRHRPEIRAVVDRMTALFRRHAALFEGRGALGGVALSNVLGVAT